MKILVTRPEPDASRLGKRLKAAGHDPVLEPLMSINYLEGSADLSVRLKAAQAIAFTSANGVRALARCYSARALPVFAVGAATAAAAREAGFETIHTSGGDVDHLAHDIAAALDPKGGPIVHSAGSVVAGDLKGTLAARNFQIDRHVLYAMTARETLSPEVIGQITDGQLDGVVVYSPRSGRVLAELVEKAGIRDGCKAIVCYCLSEAVAEAVVGVTFARCLVAATPDEDALLALPDLSPT